MEKVFILTIDDFNLVLGRELLSHEIEIVKHKFEIYDWTDHVDMFLKEHNILNEVIEWIH